ncbi:MAG: glutamine synthetase family protein [Gammaproteobacteria bacterium]
MHDPLAEARRFLQANPDVRSIDLVIYDLHGAARGKRIRAADLTRIFADGMAFSGSVFGLDPTGHVIPDTGLGLEAGDPDSLCWPVPGSLTRIPWHARALGQVQLTMHERDGTPFFADPRQVLARVLEGFRGRGLTPVVAVELEFYLLDRAAARDVTTVRPPRSPHTGLRDYGHQVYAIEDLEAFRPLLDDINAGAEALGLPLTTAVSESSPGQFEINLHHDDDAQRACDHAQLLKRLVKGAAVNHGLVASFMAKPYPELSGSGMHVHASLVDAQGSNVFAGPERDPNDALRHALGGCLRALPACTALLAPNANSFRRLRPDTFAPTNLSWGYENRSAALRVPAGAPASRRIEHRVAGADANPYLAMAVLLAGMLEGLQRGLDPGEPIQGNAATLGLASIPASWHEALDRLLADPLPAAVLGERFVRLYHDCKQYERREFEKQVTPLEYAWYLHRA